MGLLFEQLFSLVAALVVPVAIGPSLQLLALEYPVVVFSPCQCWKRRRPIRKRLQRFGEYASDNRVQACMVGRSNRLRLSHIILVPQELRLEPFQFNNTLPVHRLHTATAQRHSIKLKRSTRESSRSLLHRFIRATRVFYRCRNVRVAEQPAKHFAAPCVG